MFDLIANIFFIFLFIVSIYFLIQNRLNLKKAAEASEDALFPREEEEYSGILIPAEWKEMIPLTKDTKSYKYVHWGTIIAVLFLTALILLILTTNWFSSSFMTTASLFYFIMSVVKHRGNVFILPEGLILNGKYYSSNQIKHYEIELIVRWHQYYGLNSRVDNGYKMTIMPKCPFRNPTVVVVEEYKSLERILTLLHEKGIWSGPKSEIKWGQLEKQHK